MAFIINPNFTEMINYNQVNSLKIRSFKNKKDGKRKYQICAIFPTYQTVLNTYETKEAAIETMKSLFVDLDGGSIQ